VEELVSLKMNEKTTDSLHDSAVGTMATKASSVPTDWKKKWQYIYGLLMISSFMETAM
jgi:hypothetical protein